MNMVKTVVAIAAFICCSVCAYAEDTSSDDIIGKLHAVQTDLLEMKKKNSELEKKYIYLKETMMRCNTLVEIEADEWNSEGWFSYWKHEWGTGINSRDTIRKSNLGTKFRVVCI